MEAKDQLRVILETIGSLSDEDVSFLSDIKSINYLNRNQVDLDKIDFQREFPLTHPEIVRILASLLEFNPYFRMSAKELLRLKCFDPFRNPNMEKESPAKIELDIDKVGNFDYKLGDIVYTMEDLMRMLREEVIAAQKLKK